jgi:hypothetical protein
MNGFPGTNVVQARLKSLFFDPSKIVFVTGFDFSCRKKRTRLLAYHQRAFVLPRPIFILFQFW